MHIKNVYKISVIIPVFKVEKHIVRCAHMLFEQTLKEVEYLFIDDRSPDKSIDVLKEVLEIYPHRHLGVKFITHPLNKGLPAARNSGLSKATGEYVFHCDSDDYLERDALEIFYNKAKEADADIVWSDWYLTYAEKERYMKQPSHSSAQEALFSILSGGMKFNVWNKLVRRQLYVENDITFPEGYNMGEDMTMILLFSVAKKVAYIPRALYHYVRTNEHAYTRQRTLKQFLDVQYNAERVISFIQHKSIHDIPNLYLNNFKLNVKYPLLTTGIKEDYLRWLSWFPEVNSDVLLNKSIGGRARLIQWLAAKKCWALVWLNAYLTEKFYSYYRS